MNDVQKILNECRKTYKQFQMAVVIMILMLIAAIVTIFFNRNIAFVIIGFCLAFHFLYLRRVQKKLVDDVNTNNILLTVGNKIQADTVSKKDGGKITEETINKAQLLPHDEAKGSCLLREGISGQVNGMPVSLCDAVFAQSFHIGKRGKNRVHFTSGFFMEFELPEDTGADWRLLDKDLLPTPVRTGFYAQYHKLNKAETCSSSVNERFEFYSRGENHMPTNRFLSELEALAGYTPGKIGISLRGNKLSIFIRDRFLAMALSVKEPPTEKRLTFDPVPEFAYGVRLAEKAL